MWFADSSISSGQAAHSVPAVPLAVAMPSSAQLIWRSEADTAAFALRLAAQPALRQAYIALQGDLGAGKTTLVRHLLRALGVTGRIKSPTYAVMEPHAAPDGMTIAHFDFYRFNDPREWADAGFRDVFAAPGLKLAEWPEKAAGVLPVADLELNLSVLPELGDARCARLTAHTPTGVQLLTEVLA
jgi:tRNA threonylcarbamoyladenosine biosynthesis protein TsaE